ncbi:hypothetical protein BH11ACT4_BH11ACT4_17730 [soil metagenome]
MLTLTDNATTVIKRLATRAGSAEQAGIRIGAEPDRPDQLGVALAAQPLPGDEIVEDNGARVFLDADATPHCSDKELDAVVDDGNVRFALRTR